MNFDPQKNCIANWQYFRALYEVCKSNTEFLKCYEENASRISNYDTSLIKEKIVENLGGIQKNTEVLINKDIIINSNVEELIEKYKSGNLITCRLGCSETSFLLNCHFGKSIINDHIGPYKNRHDDKHFKNCCGMYYTKEEDRIKVHEWWCNNTLELLGKKNITITSAYLVLAYDLLLYSLLDLKNKTLHPWNQQNYLIPYFEGQKILVISNGINSMRHVYELGLQKMYNAKLPEFSMDFCFMPQTTPGMPFPHNNMIETAESVINEIEKNYYEFNTALLACGSYTAPLINILSKKFSNRNFLYLGSSLYTMFGLYSKGIQKPEHEGNFYCLDNFMHIPEKCPEACKHIDGGKYWGDS